MPRGRASDGTSRPEQPRCSTSLADGGVCSHPQSFHGRDLGRCRALGCKCPKWTKPKRVTATKDAPAKKVAARSK